MEEKTQESINESITDEYGVNELELKNDFENFISALENRGILKYL